MWLLIVFAILGAQYQLAAGCHGGDSCCSADRPCHVGQGDCDTHDQCSGDLTCGIDNCDRKSFPGFDATDDCCEEPASIRVVVRSATMSKVVPGAVVEFTIGDLNMTASADESGLATITFNRNDVVVSEDGTMTFLEVGKEGFFSNYYSKDIYSATKDELDWDITIFLSPLLPDDQMRLVLSWQSSQDLNLYAVQIDTSTGDIYCKSGTETRMPMKACDGVFMDMDSRNGKENAETMTWYLGSDDPHTYLLYVQDSDQKELTGSEAEIMFYGEDVVHGMMFNTEDIDFDARYWILGLFTPSEGLSTFDPECSRISDHEPVQVLRAKVCGSNGRTYSSEWQLAYENCKYGEDVKLVSEGACSCDCSYRLSPGTSYKWGGCKITTAPPAGFTCECKKGWIGCSGHLKKCSAGDWCPGDCTNETCCRRGGGNCGGYWSFKNVLAYRLAKFGR